MSGKFARAAIWLAGVTLRGVFAGRACWAGVRRVNVIPTIALIPQTAGWNALGRGTFWCHRGGGQTEMPSLLERAYPGKRCGGTGIAD